MTKPIPNTTNPFLYVETEELTELLVSLISGDNPESFKNIKKAKKNISILDKTLPLPKKADKKIEI